MQAFTGHFRHFGRMVILSASMAGDDEEEMALFVELDLLESFHPMKRGASYSCHLELLVFDAHAGRWGNTSSQLRWTKASGWRLVRLEVGSFKFCSL